MKSKVMPSGVHVLLLEKGEELHATLTNYCKERGIFGGHLQAIGAVEKVTLRYWYAKEKRYSEDTFDGGLEVTGLLGTVTRMGLHAHGTFSRPDYSTVAGHVASGTVNPTLEVFLTPTAPIERKMNDDVGLTLLDL